MKHQTDLNTLNSNYIQKSTLLKSYKVYHYSLHDVKLDDKCHCITVQHKINHNNKTSNTYSVKLKFFSMKQENFIRNPT